MRLRVTLAGERAHTGPAVDGPQRRPPARPRCSPALEAYEPRRPVLQGCRYREALQAVRVEGGVAGNVVPDRVELLLNHRFAPDRTPDRGRGPRARGASPRGSTRRRRRASRSSTWRPARRRRSTTRCSPRSIARNDLDVRAKLGWTDVARFAAHGHPGRQLRPGRRHDRPHRRRVRRAGPSSSGVSPRSTICVRSGAWTGRRSLRRVSAASLDRPAPCPPTPTRSTDGHRDRPARPGLRPEGPGRRRRAACRTSPARRPWRWSSTRSPSPGVCEGELCAHPRRLRRVRGGRRAGAGRARATPASPRRSGPSSRATSSRCCRTSGPTARWPRPTACSTTRSGCAIAGHVPHRQGRHGGRRLRDRRPGHAPGRQEPLRRGARQAVVDRRSARPDRGTERGAAADGSGPSWVVPTCAAGRSELAHHRDDLAEDRHLRRVEHHRLEPLRWPGSARPGRSVAE